MQIFLLFYKKQAIWALLFVLYYGKVFLCKCVYTLAKGMQGENVGPLPSKPIGTCQYEKESIL